MKKCEVIAMEGGYVENAGAVFYRLIGDKHETGEEPTLF
ncbi:hypothetical protein MNBD_GAMMA10-2148 [hydrothermal vent metagenome]|uniref:Uncharacterized protein n=1 Tax=hydrothermal vent metagenome TaxID=652676 RepID=A0A3B0XZ39_9ZZZZ